MQFCQFTSLFCNDIMCKFTHPHSDCMDLSSRLPAACESNPARPDLAGARVLSLLLPIKHACDIVHGTRYARRLREWGIPVKVNLLHVTRASHAADHDEAGPVAELLREATLYLLRSQIEHRTLILSGEVVFSILDAAEQLNCHEIVLPEVHSTPWLRLFSSNIVRQLARARNGVPLVLADPNGIARRLRRDAPLHSVKHPQ